MHAQKQLHPKTGPVKPSASKGGVYQVAHPLVEHHLARLRDARTGPAEFRQLTGRLAVLLAYEATKDLESVPTEVETPLDVAPARRLKHRIGLVPILRAGLGMVDSVLNLIPDAEVWHLGVYRDEATLRPVEYYNRFSGSRPVDVAMILDPMLATGGSALAALTILRESKIPAAKLLAVIASQDGIRKVESEFPDTQIYVCAIDPTLDSRGFIVPGLGDAGDRIFNTFPGQQ